MPPAREGSNGLWPGAASPLFIMVPDKWNGEFPPADCGRKRPSVHFRMSACGHGESWISDVPPHGVPVPPPYGYGQDDEKNEAVRTTNQLNHSCTYGWIVISGSSDPLSLVQQKTCQISENSITFLLWIIGSIPIQKFHLSMDFHFCKKDSLHYNNVILLVKTQ